MRMLHVRIRRGHERWPAFLALAALLVASSNLSAAIAQETRAEVQRQQREEKQRAAKPYKPSALERGLKRRWEEAASLS